MSTQVNDRIIWKIIILMVACLMILTVLVSCSSGAQTTTLDGAQLMAARCSICHTTDRIKEARKTAPQWEQTVTRMIGKGAKLSDAEKTVMVDYLAKTYAP